MLTHQPAPAAIGFCPDNREINGQRFPVIQFTEDLPRRAHDLNTTISRACLQQ